MNSKNSEANGYKHNLKVLIMHTKVDVFMVNQVHPTTH